MDLRWHCSRGRTCVYRSADRRDGRLTCVNALLTALVQAISCYERMCVMLKKLAILPLVAFIVIIEPLQAVAQQTAPQPPYGYGPGPWHMWSYGWHFWWMFPFMMLLLLVACGAIILFVFRSGYGPRHWGPPSQSPNQPWGDPTYSALQILNERFARGEIQKDEYAERKAAIQSSGRA